MAASASHKHRSPIKFTHQWVIKDLWNVLQNENISTKTTEIHCKDKSLGSVKFLVGFKTSPDDNTFRLYWKSLQQHSWLQNEEIILIADILKHDGTSHLKVEEKTTKAEVGTMIEPERNIFSYDYPWTYENTKLWRNSEGSLVINLEINIKPLAK